MRQERPQVSFLPEIAVSGGPLRVPAKRGASPPGKFGSALAVLLFLAFGLAGPLAIGMMPRDGQTQFAVIAAPWRGLEETAALVAAADGRIVDAGGLPNVIFAQSDSPAFVAAAYRAGAWLVLDPVLLRGCLQALGRASS